MRSSLRADLALLGVSLLWGATFPVMKIALQDATPILYLVLRFLVALAFAVPLWPSLRGRPGRGELAAGVVLGAFLALSFSLQTIALREIEPARSAFLTSLYVIFVPLIGMAALGRVPRRGTWVGVFLALGGLALMTWDGLGLTLRPADLMTVGSALGFALHIVGVAWFTTRYTPDRLFLLQMIAATLGLALFLPLEVPRLVFTWRLAGALAVTGGLATSLAFLVQNRVQRHTSPARAALVFAVEPVFALLASMVLMGRSGLAPHEGLGALAILAGLVVAEIRGQRGRQSAAAT